MNSTVRVYSISETRTYPSCPALSGFLSGFSEMRKSPPAPPLCPLKGTQRLKVIRVSVRVWDGENFNSIGATPQVAQATEELSSTHLLKVKNVSEVRSAEATDAA